MRKRFGAVTMPLPYIEHITFAEKSQVFECIFSEIYDM